MEETSIEKLAIALANAKNVEAEAKIARIKAEEELASALGGKENGSSTFHVGRFGITVKRGMNYKIDIDQDEFADRFPELARVSKKVEVFIKAYEAEREVNSDLFKSASKFVTTTPKKVAVELKL